MRDESAEILFQSFLQEALVSSSCMGKDIHSLIRILSLPPVKADDKSLASASTDEEQAGLIALLSELGRVERVYAISDE